jgi:hypothetical protein
MRAVAVGAVLAAALDTMLATTLGGCVPAGAVDAGGSVEAGPAPLGVSAVDALAAGGLVDNDDAAVDVLACLAPELHAAAKAATATRAAACKYARDVVSTGLLD